MNILKVEELRSIIISLFLFIFIIGCNETVLKSELVVINCIFYLDDQLYSGKYELQKGDRLTIGVVKKGVLKKEDFFLNNNLIMRKKISNCDEGYQTNFKENGEIISEGFFMSNKRTGLWKNYLKDSIYFVKY